MNGFITECASVGAAGFRVAVKDNICTKNIKTTAASKMLEQYVPSYDATVVERLKSAGAVIIGKTDMDEFGMGSTGEYSAFCKTINPHDNSRVAGGSSCGSAVAIATGAADYALGSDTGGSARTPASYCGVVGFKPSYGAVSRFGLIAFASSLEQISPMGRCVSDVERLFDIISGIDEKDMTCRGNITPCNESKIRVGLCVEELASATDEVKAAVLRGADALKLAGCEVTPVSRVMPEYLISTYYIISCAEASSNLARYDETRFMPRSFFGDEVKRRILMGGFVLSEGYYERYYARAQNARRLICREYSKLFEQVDVVMSQTCDTVAPKLGHYNEKPTNMYKSDWHTVSANLACLPAISVPAITDGLPIGISLMARRFDDRTLLKTAKLLEEAQKCL